MSTAALPARDEPTLFGHPRGLFLLFLVEMWERFSYYGMRGLLKAYMVYYLCSTAAKAFYPTDSPPVPTEVPSNPFNILGWSVVEALPDWMVSMASVSDFSSSMYGMYTALVYATPFFGGIIADRWLGQRKAVYIGGIVMALGHFVMASEQLFLLALGLLCGAVGFLMYFRLIADTGATNALTVTYLIPPFGILWGMLFLGETLPPGALAGAVLDFHGVADNSGLKLRAFYMIDPDGLITPFTEQEKKESDTTGDVDVKKTLDKDGTWTLVLE